MRLSDIISFLKEYMTLGIIAVIFVGLLFLIGYKLIYHKILKGTKKISKSRMFLYGISICYGIVVLGAVFLNRGNMYGVMNLHLFSSYREAYNEMQISLFRNIILNILLFIPLGFLLPIYSDKLKKIYKVAILGFVTTLLIEFMQYITKRGIFEIDDIFNNTVGAILGYCVFMIYYRLKNNKNRNYIITYILPFIIIFGSFLGIYIKYENQEFGNLASNYNYKINMKNVKIESNIEYQKNGIKKDIYYSKILSENETRKIAESIFSECGTRVSEDDIDIYENTAIYYSENREYNVWVTYRGGTYSFTDFSKFSENGIQETIGGKTREEIEEALKKIGINISEKAEFKEEQSGQYIFTVDMEIDNNTLTNGILSCNYYEDGTVKNVSNNIINYSKIAEKEIISEEEAYNNILEGKFQYNSYLYRNNKNSCNK